MKKKLLSLVLALVMVISLVPTSLAAAGLGNFKKTNTYTPGMFRDVFSSDWYATNVIAAYQFGLVKGTTATNFNPKGNITVAETIALACRLHSIYNTGAANFTQGNPWYQVYVDYALSKGIIKGAYSNYNAKISRADFAFILNNSLPAEALKGINNVPANTLADVANDNRAGAIYNLYRAGILTGNDKYGTFSPNSNIQRSEVATIVTRMADQTQRKTFTLETKPVVPQSVTLAGKTTILAGETTQWKATISPAGANQWVSWNSGNPGVATVDANGNIKGIKEGQSNITATASNGVKKTVVITVEKAPENVAGTELNLKLMKPAPVEIKTYNEYGSLYNVVTVDDISYEEIENDNKYAIKMDALVYNLVTSKSVYVNVYLKNEQGVSIASGQLWVPRGKTSQRRNIYFFDVPAGTYYVDFEFDKFS